MHFRLAEPDIRRWDIAVVIDLALGDLRRILGQIDQVLQPPELAIASPELSQRPPIGLKFLDENRCGNWSSQRMNDLQLMFTVIAKALFPILDSRR